MLQNIMLPDGNIDPDAKLLEITRRVVDAVRVPVTAKTRLGWNHEQLCITSLAEQLQDCGIQALTIHGRTRSQMYTGEADWTLIGEVKRNPRIHIPIIGNGDIKSLSDADRAFDSYGVDAVMIGRATSLAGREDRRAGGTVAHQHRTVRYGGNAQQQEVG